MAKITTSGLITDIRGKVGGCSFQKSQGGLSLRGNQAISKAVRVNRSASLVLTSNVQKSWSNLTQDELDYWHAFARFQGAKQKFDKSKFLSAQQLYQVINYNRLAYGFAILNTPAFVKNDLTPVTAYPYFTGTAITFFCSRALVAANEFLVLHMSRRIFPSVNFNSVKLRLIPVVTTNSQYQNFVIPYSQIYGYQLNDNDTVVYKYFLCSHASGMRTAIINAKTTI